MELASGISLWSPTVVVVGGVQFHTTLETLQQYPKTELCRLFSPPYPLMSAESGHHIISSDRCPHPDLFGYVLEYLRNHAWHIPQDREVYSMVCMVAAGFDIPSRPPPVIDCSYEERRYDHKVVTLPVPVKQEDTAPGPSRPATEAPTANTALMLATLGFKGYQLVSETRGDANLTTNITLRREAPICKGVETLARQSPMFQKLLQAA